MNNEEIAVTLAEHKKEIRSLEYRVDEIEKLTNAVNQMAISVRELAVNLANVDNRMARYEDSLRSQGERIGELEKKPARRWDLLVTTIITALASGVVGFMLSNFLG